MRRAVLALVVWLIWTGSAHAQSTCTTASTCTPIKKLDCGVAGASFPLCGADTNLGSLEGVNWSWSWQNAIGPAGEGGIRIVHIGDTDETQEYYVGGHVWAVPSVGQNACRYFREKIKFLSPINWQDEIGGRFGGKHISWGQDGTNDSSRMFVNVRSDLSVPGGVNEPTEILLQTDKNVDGPPSQSSVHDLTHSVIYYLQVEACTSVTSGSSDGSLKVWINNNTYGSPTAQNSGGFAWPALDLNQVRVGMYFESLGTTGSASWEIYAFEYDDQFSTDWNGSGAGGGGAPVKFRFRRR
jgi:hypothetical protein